MAPKRPGPSSAYLGAYKDKAGKVAGRRYVYRLRVRPHPPIKLSWSVTIYDADTRALILNEQKVADRSSRMGLRKSNDASVDIYCGPQTPAGFEKNWIATVPGKNWFAYFRFHQPTEALLRSVLAVAGLRADIDANARHVLGLRTVSESGLGYSSVRSQPVVARGRRWWWRVAPSVWRRWPPPG